MSDTYTPTTEEVRDAYADRKDFESQVRTGLHASEVESLAEFHRWLAAHDAQVRAEALALAIDTSTRYRCCSHCVEDPSYHEDNPPDSHTTPCGTWRHPCGAGGDDPVSAPPAHNEGGKR